MDGRRGARHLGHRDRRLGGCPSLGARNRPVLGAAIGRLGTRAGQSPAGDQAPLARAGPASPQAAPQSLGTRVAYAAAPKAAQHVRAADGCPGAARPDCPGPAADRDHRDHRDHAAVLFRPEYPHDA